MVGAHRTWPPWGLILQRKKVKGEDEKKMKTRTSKALGVALLLSLALNIGVIYYHYVRGRDQISGEVRASSQEVYVCPMHPQVVSDRPGDCPICGMKLVKRAKEGAVIENLADVGTVALDPGQEVLANVKTDLPMWMNFAPFWELPAVVTYNEETVWRATTRAMGRVEKLYVSTLGAQVQAGDPLYDLYSPDLIAAQEEYLMALKSTDPAVSEALLESARRKLLSLGAEGLHIHNLHTTGLVSQTLTFHAPYPGTLLEKMTDVGNWVMAGESFLKFADLSTLYLEAAAPEQVGKRIKVGHRVEIVDYMAGEREGEGNKERELEVVYLSPSLDPATRTYLFRARLPNRDGSWRVGEFLRVRVPQGEPFWAWGVPEEAVLHTGRGTLVWVESSPGHFRPQPVRIGDRYQGMIAVLEGLTGTERVVVSGGYLLDSDAAIKMGKGEGHQHRPSKAPPPTSQEKGPERSLHSGHTPSSHSGASPSKEDEGKPAQYTCPMHPDFITTDPEARCPECGMKVSPREK